jgi:hypothetical protein
MLIYGEFLFGKKELDWDYTIGDRQVYRVTNNNAPVFAVDETDLTPPEFYAVMTYEQIGRALGITKERVRQIELKALRKLMSPSRAAKLKGFL